MWIVIRRPVEINGRSFFPNQGKDSFIPPELVAEMTSDVRKSCIQVADGAFDEPVAKPVYVPASAPASAAPSTEAK